MSDDILELKEEIKILTERISVLEKRENRRRSLGYLKILFKVLLLGLFIFGLFKGYNYIVHDLPTIIDEKIKISNILKKK